MRSQEKFRHSKIRFTDRDKVQDFSKETTTGVIHFAASKAVGESVENRYYTMKTMSVPWFMLLQELQKMTEANFILVHLVLYGQAEKCRLLKMHRFKSDVSLWKYQANWRRNHNRRC
jgi:UDP-glucose 4-epimerase